MTFRYLNTDLDLVAPVNLSGIASALESRGLFALHVTSREDGQCVARFESEDTFHEPVANIEAMLTAVESLNELNQAVWHACSWREFNVGYNCGTSGYLMQSWPVDLLQRIGKAGASLGLTLYSPE